MNHFRKSRAAISNGIFGAVVVLLVVVAGVGYGLYATTSAKTVVSTSTSTVTKTNVSTEMMSTTEMMNHTFTGMMGNATSGCACQFTPKAGAMISHAWILMDPVGTTNSYAMSIHAEGLEANGTYLVEGVLNNGSMNAVPISSEMMNMSTADSEFQTNVNGTGNYFALFFNSSPSALFGSIELLYLPGMSMQNATVVATVNLASMMGSETSMMTSQTSSMMTTETTMMNSSSS